MPILFFDTETTGLPDKRAPITAPHQPHIVQLAAILTDDDGTERASLNLIVDPGVSIPKGASDVHGITDDIALRFGVTPAAAAMAFRSMAERADKLAAHNIGFDRLLVGILLKRVGAAFSFTGESYCTMEASAPVVNLPPTERMVAAGIDKPKAPKLSEAYRHFFGKELEGAHDALVDVRACRDVYLVLNGMRAEIIETGDV